MSDSSSKSTEGRSKPGVGWGLTSGEFCDDRCMFSSKEERVALYPIKREPSDMGWMSYETR